MINLLYSLALAAAISVLSIFGLQVAVWISVPMGVLAGFALFVILGRKVQGELEAVMSKMQREIQEQKMDRAIATLEAGKVALKNRHFFIAKQMNSQIGVIHYLQGSKHHEAALSYFEKGFMRHFVAQGMMAVIYYKRKDYDKMKKTMDDALAVTKKEAIVYGLYAYLLYQIKEKDEAIAILQKGLKKLPDDPRLTANLTQLQNNKKMKMKVFGDLWTQFMLERAPRVQQQLPPHLQKQMRRKQMFR